jgi:hypothetical protein
MATITELIADRAAARSRYASAVSEFRAAFASLAALDRLLACRGVDSPSFGDMPNIVLLRHPVVNAAESGSLEANVAAIIETTAIEG